MYNMPMIKIGNVNIDTNVFLAPLAGCSDLPFRLIAREHGAKFCFYEMVDANALNYKRRQTFGILKTTKKDLPIAGQLLGADPDGMLDAAQKLLKLVNISFLDINCACPAKKVIKKKAGAYLLRDTPRLYNILNKLIPALSLPITMKIRIGYNTKDVPHITDMVKRCEDLGVAAIFVHGRLMTQGYAGEIDYNFIKEIKNSVKIPVFGSGNIFSPEMGQKMFDETGCDGIMIARGALGNPWIFQGKDAGDVSIEERKKVLKKHLSYIDKYKEISPSGKIGFMKKIVIWYLKSVIHAARVREKVTRVKSYEEMLNLIDSLQLD